MEKKAQQTMGLPFGVIFSLMLIIAFIIIAIIAVNYFLDTKNQVLVLSFYDDLQQEVKKALFSQQSEKDFKISLPSKINSFCVINFSNEIKGKNEELFKSVKGVYSEENNVFLYPIENVGDNPFYRIDYLNIEKMTLENNPECFDTKKTLNIKKEFYDKSVLIEEKVSNEE
jgi:uncharacterized membrane protein